MTRRWPCIVVAVVCCLAGCATAPDFPRQPTTVWGYRSTFPANNMFSFVWSPTAADCARDLADDRARNPTTVRSSDCLPIIVNDGGPLWGFPFVGRGNSGFATGQKADCERIRGAINILMSLRQPSCTPVTVTVKP